VISAGSSRRLAAVALAVAVVLLVGSIAWTLAANDDDDRWGWGRLGPGMMAYAPLAGPGSPVRSLEEAREQAQQFGRRLDLRVGEVMQFENHFYAELVDDESRPATEVLVDPRSGAVAVEPGPAMMWNTRYGMMSGRGGMGPGMMGGTSMMGGPGMMGADPVWPARSEGQEVSATEARRFADRWLRSAGSRLRAGEAESFPGYFTFHTILDGRVSGMLSVNASTGAVWPHWWHGRFVRMSS
jgi:hypothetical protein